MYPKIFQSLIPRDVPRSKKSATSHSTNWGKRSTKTSNSWARNPPETETYQIPWKIIRRGLKRSPFLPGHKEVAKRMWVPEQEVHKPADGVPPVETNGNEKKELVFTSRIISKIYKKLRQQRARKR